MNVQRSTFNIHRLKDRQSSDRCIELPSWHFDLEIVPHYREFLN